MYAKAPSEGAFHQGEILSNVVQLCVLLPSLEPAAQGYEFDAVSHPFALILTQDCDLDWDYAARTTEGDEAKRQLKAAPDILLCELFPESDIRPTIKGSDIWKRIIRNQDERYHWIPVIAVDHDLSGEGLPALVADFKHVFTIRTDELYHRLQLELGRRTVLRVPWVQDVANRYAYYASRVALPVETATGTPALLPEGTPTA